MAEELEETEVEGNALLGVFEEADGTISIPMESHNRGLSDYDRKQFMLKLLVKLQQNPNMEFSSKAPEC